MRTVTVHERLNIRTRLALAGYNSMAFEAVHLLSLVNHSNVFIAKNARRIVADVFSRATGRPVARFLGWV